MSGRATGEERSPLSVPERERERERPPVSRSKRPAPPPSPAVCAFRSQPRWSTWWTTVGRVRRGGREGGRGAPSISTAVTVSSIRRWIAAECTGCFESGCARIDRPPPQNFDSRLDPRCIFWGNWNFIIGNEARSFGGNILRMCVQGVWFGNFEQWSIKGGDSFCKLFQ